MLQQTAKELSMDVVCMFKTKQIIICYRTKYYYLSYKLCYQTNQNSYNIFDLNYTLLLFLSILEIWTLFDSLTGFLSMKDWVYFGVRDMTRKWSD